MCERARVCVCFLKRIAVCALVGCALRVCSHFLACAPNMNDLAAIVVEKLHLRDGYGHFVLVVCEHDNYLHVNAP